MSEDLKKSIDTLIDELFSEEVSKSDPLNLAADSKTTADAAIASAPSMEKDEGRGAGRPKQISQVPQNDEDGKREGEYDGSISEEESDKGDEPSETKQSPSIDQTSEKGRIAQSPKAPESAPFKKSLSEAEFNEYLSLKKSADEAKQAQSKAEELKKSETLIKSAVAEATSTLKKENEELRKSFAQTQELIKAMAAQPQRAKSVTGIDVLEKSTRPEDKREESFTKSEILDAATDLVLAGKLQDVVVSEIEMTGRVADADARRAIERKLQGK